MPARPTLFHIPVCPFCQRIEILLALKGLTDVVDFVPIDITKPRAPELLAKTRGVTSLPVLELEDGTVLNESLVILRYLEERFSAPAVFAPDPRRRAIENMLIARENPFVSAGYTYVLNRDATQREALRERLLAQYAALDAFLAFHAPDRDFLFDTFGYAEAVYTPMFMRFWFLEYYEDFALPDEPRFARVARWRDACLAHPAAQQVTREEIVKLYYDYAMGAGNGQLLPGRTRSSFEFDPHWRTRPWPPREKYGAPASDAALGLLMPADA
jgi:glutathione S-transferase